jgi:hypothetical protein
VPKSKETDGGLDDVRQSLVEKLNEVDEQLVPYQELVEKKERLASALAALDGGQGIKKRVKWEEVAEYLAEHPKSTATQIGAGLEIPATNAQAHLLRQQGTVFEPAGEGWDVIKGWEKHRRDRKGR